MKSLLADLFKQSLPNEEEFDAITISLASPRRSGPGRMAK
jgi:DNA-directed RNA polymerase subunit beta'